MRNVVVLGGGASGLFAAIWVKRTSPSVAVTVLERLDRVGKKILATGNGRCNYTNTMLSAANYYGGDSVFISDVLGRFDVERTLAFFRKLGVEPRFEERSRVFPYSGTASAVLDALRFECERLGIASRCGFRCVSLRHDSGRWVLCSDDGHSVSGNAVIIAAGGKASPSLGSDGSGFELLASLGIDIMPTAPALVQLRTVSDEVRALQGIKVNANVSALSKGECLASDSGEVLFTDYGLSGPPVFQLSVLYAQSRCDAIALDLVPDLCKGDVLDMLWLRRDTLGHLSAENFFTGLLHKKVGFMLLRRAGVEKLSLHVCDFSDELLRRLAEHIKDLQFDIAGTHGWQHAQVTAGGVATRQFNAVDLQAKTLPGLFAAGEVLDVMGDCGGFNLQWAWSSGYVAGVGAARYSGGQNV